MDTIIESVGVCIWYRVSMYHSHQGINDLFFLLNNIGHLDVGMQKTESAIILINTT